MKPPFFSPSGVTPHPVLYNCLLLAGSDMMCGELDLLAIVGFIPCSQWSLWRVTKDGEEAPRPAPTECVLFTSHLERGLSPHVHPFLPSFWKAG